MGEEVLIISEEYRLIKTIKGCEFCKFVMQECGVYRGGVYGPELVIFLRCAKHCRRLPDNPEPCGSWLGYNESPDLRIKRK